MSAAHTPGPWKVVFGRSGLPRGIQAPKDSGVAGAVGCVIRFNGIGMPSTGLANAHLIAAAPDILAALKSFYAMEDAALQHGQVSGDEIRHVMLVARVAISKAEGRS